MDDMKKKMESAASLIKGYEEAKKKIQRDLEVMQLRSVENDKLNKSKTKLQSEVRSLMATPTCVKFDIPVQENDVQPKVMKNNNKHTFNMF